MSRLLQHEKRLRRHWTLDPAIEHLVTRHPVVFLGLRRNAGPGTRYRVILAQTKGSKWTICLEDSANCGGSGTPAETSDCATISILCQRPATSRDWRDLSCELVSAG